MAGSQIVKQIEKNTLMIKKIVNHLEDYMSISSNRKIERIFLFSNLTSLRLDFKAQRELLELLTDQFSKKVFYLPAFTYNCRRNVPFSINEPPSPQNGSLSRVAFEEGMHKGDRTFDDDYSYLVLGGENRSEITKHNESEWRDKSFGDNSHHESLFLEQAVFFCIGNGLRDGFTPAMHIEALQGVKYRRFITFPSQVHEGRDKHYYARNEEAFAEFGKKGRENLVTEFKKNPETSFRRYPIGIQSEIYAFTLIDFLCVANRALSVNPNFFVE
jgi:hypothetical protein